MVLGFYFISQKWCFSSDFREFLLELIIPFHVNLLVGVDDKDFIEFLEVMRQVSRVERAQNS